MREQRVISVVPCCGPATCARYLLLYPVRLVVSEKTGFTAPLGALKPKPLVLRLDLKDISKYNLQECSFKRAEFDAKENHIVTSTNNLVIIWDFVSETLNPKP